jgi:hypothetical protein
VTGQSIVVSGPDPWRSALAAQCHASRREHPEPAAQVGVMPPADDAVQSAFAAASAEAVARHCESAIWHSLQFVRDSYRAMSESGGLILMVEVVDRVTRFAADDAVTAARAALVMSAAERWRPAGVATILLTIGLVSGACGDSVLPIGPAATQMIDLLTSGSATALSGQHFTA